MKDFLDFWDKLGNTLYILAWIIILSPMLIGLIMIITGNGHNNVEDDYTIDTTEVNEPNPFTIPQQNHDNYNDNNVSTTPNYITRPYKKTPNDAYNEGYDNGYEQGEYDGRNGYSEESNYDDSNNYYDYYEEKYIEGYRSGYEEGYYSGHSTYEDRHSEDE